MESHFMMPNEEYSHTIIWGNNMRLCTKTHILGLEIYPKEIIWILYEDL